jgi:hypothetical protein
LTKATDKYGISARITSEAILGLKGATDLQLKAIFDAQQGTINASQQDFDDYIAMIKGFKTKAEQEALDTTSPIDQLTKDDKKRLKDIANELENLRKQLVKLRDDRELFWLNQNKGIVGIERMNDHLRTQLQLQLSLQKAELEKKGLLSSSPETDNSMQKVARDLFNQIQEESFILFDAEATKRIEDFNKHRLEIEKELQFKMRQLQLISIQGDEESLVTAANERFDKEKEQALENAKVTGEDITIVLADIEQRRQQELLNIRRTEQQKGLDDEFRLLDIEEREKLAKVKVGTLKEENEKAAIRLQFAQERLKLAQQLLDELIALEENSGTNTELRKQIEDLQIKIRELNLEMSDGTANSSAKMQQNMQKVANILTQIASITDAIINGIRQVMEEIQKQTDFQIEQQEKRVDAATKLAEKGNAEILQEELKRQEKLLQERKKQVAAQKALDVIQFVSSSVVAIANAAAQGGGFASIATVAAVIGAIAGGIALVTSISNSFAKGGYTGDGGKYEPAGIVHKGEFVNTKETTSRSKDALTDIHKGKFDDSDYSAYKRWKKRRDFKIDYDKMSLSKFAVRAIVPESQIHMMQSNTDVTGIHDRLDEVVDAVKNIQTQVPVMSDKGVFHLAKKGESKLKRIFRRP